MISVIVPVYNAEKTIEKCINSIRKSVYPNIEIILVNDGSTDSTLKLCERLKCIDKRITIINKVNEGAGLSRQVGLDAAKGNYISFVDADDWIEDDLLFLMKEKIEKYNGDVCFCGYTKHEDNKMIKVPIDYPKDFYCCEEIKQQLMHNCVWFAKEGYPESPISAVWMGMYKKNVINENNIMFVSERKYYSEDSIFNLMFLKGCKKVVFLKKEKYHLIRLENSLSNVFDERYEKVNNWYEMVEMIIRAESKPINGKVMAYLNNTYFNMYRAYVDRAIQNNNFYKNYNNIKNIYPRIVNIDIKKIADINLKTKIIYYLIKHHIMVYRLLMILKEKIHPPKKSMFF